MPHTLTSRVVCNPPVEDWPALIARRPNVLMSGPREATDVFVREVTSHLLSPIRRLASDALRSLPSVGGTLILDGVEALDRQQQEMFLRWLVEGSHTKTQVISLTPTRLYSQVQTGEFLPALYYRLNVIYVEVSLVDAER